MATGEGLAVAPMDSPEAGVGPPPAPTKRALIVIPSFAGVEPKPFGNFLCMALVVSRRCLHWAFDVLVPERKLLHGAMNEAAEVVVKSGHDGMIVCDDDCLPPFAAMATLIGYADQGYDYVAGLGLMKNFPHTTTVGRYYPEGVSLVIDEQSRGSLSGFEWVDDITRLEPGLNEIDFCGVPIAWISGRLLRAIEPPWFGTQWDGGECTHDVFFAKKVQAAGFKIYVDADMPCGHTTLPGVVTFENRTVTRAWVKTMTPEERQAMR